MNQGFLMYIFIILLHDRNKNKKKKLINWNIKIGAWALIIIHAMQYESDSLLTGHSVALELIISNH